MKYIVRPYRRGEEQYVADAHCRLNTAGGRLLRSMLQRSPRILPARSRKGKPFG